MGHMTGKEAYRMLGQKLDGLATRHIQNDDLYHLLRELYTEQEAQLVVKMPYRLASFTRISKLTGLSDHRLRNLLDSLSTKGLIIDIHAGGAYYYAISPLFVGFFEFTMMRSGQDATSKVHAGLLNAYMHGNGGEFFAANAADDHLVPSGRIVPRQEALQASEYTEVLDFEKATEIIDRAAKIAVGVCSCRHTKSHVGNVCGASMDVCTSFDGAADHLIQHGLGREISKAEMLDTLNQSREERLVLTVDNVKNQPTFMCHCCSCCCTFMQGVNLHGYPRTVVTSNFISHIDMDACNSCGVCVIDCPVDCITLEPIENPMTRAQKKGRPVIDTDACIGCGVCDIRCKPDAIKLRHRPQRTFTPEDSFEKVILQSLERGTLQNQIFDDPNSLTQDHLRAITGAFLKLKPVKRALMSDTLRSRFLGALRP